jgi:hypothetical protein
METISFKAPPGTKRRLGRAARQVGASPSKYALLAVERAMAEQAPKRPKLTVDPETGLPKFVLPPGTPGITTEWVHQQLASFP